MLKVQKVYSAFTVYTNPTLIAVRERPKIRDLRQAIRGKEPAEHHSSKL